MDWKDMAGEHLVSSDKHPDTSALPCVYCGRFQGYESIKIKGWTIQANVDAGVFSKKCLNCANYSFMFLETTFHAVGPGGFRLYKYVIYPTQTIFQPHESWPENVGEYVIEIKQSLKSGSWNSAAIISRTVIQGITRDFEAEGENLYQEIEWLAEKRIITESMKEWAHHVRDVGNQFVHPKSSTPKATEDEARDLARFMEALLFYVYTLPWDMNLQKKRMKPSQ